MLVSDNSEEYNAIFNHIRPFIKALLQDFSDHTAQKMLKHKVLFSPEVLLSKAMTSAYLNGAVDTYRGINKPSRNTYCAELAQLLPAVYASIEKEIDAEQDPTAPGKPDSN